MVFQIDTNYGNRSVYYFLRLLCEKTEEYQCKMLLCYSSDRGLELFNSWTLSPVEKKF